MIENHLQNVSEVLTEYDWSSLINFMTPLGPNARKEFLMQDRKISGSNSGMDYLLLNYLILILCFPWAIMLGKSFWCRIGRSRVRIPVWTYSLLNYYRESFWFILQNLVQLLHITSRRCGMAFTSWVRIRYVSFTSLINNFCYQLYLIIFGIYVNRPSLVCHNVFKDPRFESQYRD